MVVVRLALGPATVLLIFGVFYLVALIGAYGPSGWPGGVLGLAGFLVTFASVAVIFFGSSRMLLGFAGAIALFLCMQWTDEATTQRALAERGRTSDCLVLEKKERTVTDHQPGTSPGDPGTTSTHSEYVYGLRCPEERPDRMVTLYSAADKGAVIAVRWDPTGRIEPRPAGRREDSARPFRNARVAGGLALLVVALDGLLDVWRYPRPPAFDLFPVFFMAADRWR
jgi:hypothetical protein